MNALRVLIATFRVADWTGAEMAVHDLASGLLRKGHRPVVFAPTLGELAEHLRGKGVPVVNDLALIGDTPEVIHGQHHPETMMALLRFPGVPGIYVCHDRMWWCDYPPKFPRLRQFVAVDENCRDRLVNEHAVNPDRVQVIFNAVDLERFKPRPPLPARPRRALMFSNYATESGYLQAVREGCEAAGIRLDVVGSGAGSSSRSPESLLPGYDVVFGKARCALEAMACGTAVVLCDYRGLGPMVSASNLAVLRRQNFGMRALTEAITPAGVQQRLEAYDPVDAAAVAGQIRSQSGLDSALAEWVDLYRRIADGPRDTSPTAVEEELRATSAYLHELRPRLSAGSTPSRQEFTWWQGVRRVFRPLFPRPVREAMRKRGWL